MKKYKIISIILLAFLMFQCVEQVERIVIVENTEEIEKKLQELRNLQRLINSESREVNNLSIDLQNKIDELNKLIAPGNIPITYAIGIVSAGGGINNVGVSGATVNINVRGQRLISTTDSDGQVVFENLRSGIVLVDITVDGFTDVSFIADLRVDNDAEDYSGGESGNPYNVTSAIALYPTTLANEAARIFGSLYYDPNRTDDVIDPLDPAYGLVNYNNTQTNVIAPEYVYRPAEVINFEDNVEISRNKPLLDARVQTWQPLNRATRLFVRVFPNPADYSFVTSGPGAIILVVYQDMFITATSDTEGNYNIIIPAGVNSNIAIIHCEEFAGNEQYFRAFNFDTATSTTTGTTRSRPVVFEALYAINGSALSSPGLSATGTWKTNRFQYTHTAGFVRRVNIYYGARTRSE